MAAGNEYEKSDTTQLARLGGRWKNRFDVILATNEAADSHVACRVRNVWPDARWETSDDSPLPPADAVLARRATREKRRLCLTTGGPAIRPVTREGSPSGTEFAIVHAWGCPCDCAYCFLQSEQTGWRPVLRTDPTEVVSQVERFCNEAAGPIRLHAGEVCDVFAFDPLTGVAAGLADAVRPFGERVRLELRTKMDCVDGLLATTPAENVVVSFTLCPKQQARQYDFGADPPEARIAAAVRCQQAGWRVGLRFDPIVTATGWEHSYDELLEELSQRLDPERIADVSLGVLRYDAALRRIMRRRWPRLGVGSTEYQRCSDGLMRPSRPIRSAIYRHLLARLRAWLGDVAVEFCMETPAVLRDCGIYDAR